MEGMESNISPHLDLPTMLSMIAGLRNYARNHGKTLISIRLREETIEDIPLYGQSATAILGIQVVFDEELVLGVVAPERMI